MYEIIKMYWFISKTEYNIVLLRMYEITKLNWLFFQ